MSKYILIVGFLLAASFVSAEEKVIRINITSDPNARYAVNMLELALANIKQKYRIETNNADFTQARANEEVRTNGLLDLVWTTSDSSIETSLQPIRIPLFKGLLGHRIFIIHKDDQAKFDHITTLDQLKKLKLGQGRTWSDTLILEANGFNVIKTNKYPSLFFMIEGGRFDAFPRGVHEPFGELNARPNMQLTVEKNLMIVYRMPFYFFVSKENKTLARDIEMGLNAAIADGSFDKAFMNDPSVKDVIEKANMKNRRVFYLDNPTLSKETPLDRTELWFDPKDLP